MIFSIRRLASLRDRCSVQCGVCVWGPRNKARGDAVALRLSRLNRTVDQEALLFFWFFFVGMTPQSTTALLLLLLFVWVGGWVGGWVFWSRVPGIVHDLNRCAPS